VLVKRVAERRALWHPQDTGIADTRLLIGRLLGFQGLGVYRVCAQI
jgi:hypothetical protein